MDTADAISNWPTAPWKLSGTPAGRGFTSIVTASLLSVALREPRKSLGTTSAAGSMVSGPETVGKSTVCSSVTRYVRPAASMLYSFWSGSCLLQKPVNAGA